MIYLKTESNALAKRGIIPDLNTGPLLVSLFDLGSAKATKRLAVGRQLQPVNGRFPRRINQYSSAPIRQVQKSDGAFNAGKQETVLRFIKKYVINKIVIVAGVRARHGCGRMQRVGEQRLGDDFSCLEQFIPVKDTGAPARSTKKAAAIRAEFHAEN